MQEVLDPCCGSRMFHFDRNHPQVLYGDRRSEQHVLCDGRQLVIEPDELIDFRDMPYADGSFNLIVLDPPHLHTGGETSWIVKKYGKLSKDTWQADMTAAFNECWRVLANGGTLIFKWNETQIKIREILECFPEKPLFGHTTTHNLKTHWMVFYKSVGQTVGP